MTTQHAFEKICLEGERCWELSYSTWKWKFEIKDSLVETYVNELQTNLMKKPS